MNDTYWDAFFELHKDLPREGPGEPSDVAWAAETAELKTDARILDAACGPGADIAALLTAAPHGHVTATDKVEQFVGQAREQYSTDDRATIQVGDMSEMTGPFDFIWCAGAVYFLGVTAALRTWRTTLSPGGAVAFSQVCWFTDTPSDAARAGWADYPDMTDEEGLGAQIDAAGYSSIGTKRLSDAAWETYFEPIDRRIEMLRPNASEVLTQVLDEAVEETALWRRERASFGYLLCVVRPK